jgi:hypothetical protein
LRAADRKAHDLGIRFGLAMPALAMLMVMLTNPYWGWLGLPLTRR